jgi:hypothetical protein
MMKLTILFLIVGGLFGLFPTIEGYAQSCRDYEKKCHTMPKDFKSSSLSRSFAIRKMKKIKLNTTFFGGRTYNIAVCGKGRLGNLHIRLVSDDEFRTVLYDNAADDFATEKNFEFGESLNVFIEISAPQFFDEDDFECAGVSISYKNLAQ